MPSPFFTLFQTQPNYNKLRSFVCLRFLWKNPYTSHKIQPWYEPCIFLGYILFQSAYICYNYKTNQFYNSRHVQFIENIFQYYEKSSQEHTHLNSNDINPNRFKEALAAQFALKDLGQPSHFLGVGILPTKSGLFLTQLHYIRDILLRENNGDCKLVSTPMVTSLFSQPTPNSTSRIKHVAIDYHFIRDLVASKKLRVSHVLISNQLVDLLKKPLSSMRHHFSKDKIRVIEDTSILRGWIGVLSHL